MRKFFISIFILIACKSFSQDTVGYIDINKTDYVDTVTELPVAYLSADSSLQTNYSFLHFQMRKRFRSIAPALVSKFIIGKLKLANHSDSSRSVYFFPGFFFNDIAVYRESPAGLIPLPNILPHNPDSIGFRLISLSAQDSAIFVVQLHQVKTYNNNFYPRLVNPKYLNSFVNDMHHLLEKLDQTTYIFAGLLLMMILFSLANYIEGGNREFLYYSGYAFFLGGMLFSHAFFNYHAMHMHYFIESWLDFIMQSIGIAFYMIFMRQFLEAKNNHPFLYKFYNSGIILMTSSVVIYSYVHFFTNNYVIEYWVETATKFLLLLMIIIFLIYAVRNWNNWLFRFLFWGNFSLFVFSLISQSMISFKLRFNIPSILNASLFYYEVGLFLEFVFFLIALSYKNRMQIIEQTKEREWLKMENQRKEFEKQMAVVTAQQEERNRISTDMHDELGSGMTAIRLMSEIAKNKMKGNTPPEIEKISQSADDVLNKMNAIIWSMNNKNDSLGNLVSYIRSYSIEYLDNTPVSCKVTIPDYVPDVELTGDKRRNVFLCVKESLNNVLKHSKANAVQIDISVNGELMIQIYDNGVGIDLQHLRQFGNGLQNIERRMKSIGGDFKIENDHGTISTLKLPL